MDQMYHFMRGFPTSYSGFKCILFTLVANIFYFFCKLGWSGL